MHVPLTIGDFLERAALVYGRPGGRRRRTGRAGLARRITYAEMHDRARGMALRPRRHGRRPRRAGGHREPELGPLPHRLLRGERVRARARARQLPAQRRRGRLHRRALGGLGAARRPRARRATGGRVGQGAARARRRRATPSCSRPRRPVPSRRAGQADEDATCSINYTSGTTARPKGVQLTHRNCWLNAAMFGWHTTVSDRDTPAAHAAHVPLQRLGHALRGDGHGRPPRGAAQGRRRGDPGPHRGRGRHAAVRGAGGGGRHPRRRRRRGAARGRGRARAGHGAHRGGRRPAAVEDHRARSRPSSGGSSSRSTGSPRPLPCSPSTGPRRSGTTSTPPSAPRCLARAGVPAVGVRMRVDEDGEILARTNHVFDGYWEQPEETATALEGGWFHTGDGGYLDGAYTVIADRKKDVIITGGENVSSIEVEDCLYQHPRWPRRRSSASPTTSGARPSRPWWCCGPGTRSTEAELIEFCRARLAHFKAPDVGRVPRRAGPHRHRQAPEVQAAPALLGGPRPPGELSRPATRRLPPPGRVDAGCGAAAEPRRAPLGCGDGRTALPRARGDRRPAAVAPAGHPGGVHPGAVPLRRMRPGRRHRRPRRGLGAPHGVGHRPVPRLRAHGHGPRLGGRSCPPPAAHHPGPGHRPTRRPRRSSPSTPPWAATTSTLPGTWVTPPTCPPPRSARAQEIPAMFADTVLVRVEHRVARGRLMVELDGHPGRRPLGLLGAGARAISSPRPPPWR